jgi:hypothetical protein
MNGQRMSDYGFVYVLSNRCMPGIFKIGYTSRTPLQRCNELSASTSCPFPFEVFAYIETDTAAETERELHEQYDYCRVSSNREFFRCDPFDILLDLSMIAGYGYYFSHLARKAFGMHDPFMRFDESPAALARKAEPQKNPVMALVEDEGAT